MNKVVIVAGPTASGKSEVSIKLAKALNGEVVSCDSAQIYEGMDIGTSKVSKKDMQGIEHHLLDICKPQDDFTVANFKRECEKVIDDIHSRGKLPILCGGTGLYINAIMFDMQFEGVKTEKEARQKFEEMARKYGNEYLYKELQRINPGVAERIHPNNTVRVIRALSVLESEGCDGRSSNLGDLSLARKRENAFDFIKLVITWPRDVLYSRINKRVDTFFDEGLVSEVQGLLEGGVPQEANALKAIGYKEIVAYLNGETDLKTANELIKRNTRRFAKRQLTWFKRYDDFHWFDMSETTDEEIVSWVAKNM